MRLKDATVEENSQSDVLPSCPPCITIVNFDLMVMSQVNMIGEPERDTFTHHSHLVIARMQGGVFHAHPNHPEEEIQPVERHWREDPRRRIYRMVANRDKERAISEDTTEMY